ncbi:sulfurtransferase complex subunit TusC [Thiopseudomonas alkaliphila]|uniref:sulfurtransferase complex subunit TusC n=1 Tax=Thiopseudomonas alkaliphila TaxID=1697053 RepID=UPI00069E90C1|nr:sulfurtransferase complex subunit TusC [Thiopseudomonas alkaliphila]AKX51983.1 sulfur relay protein TusC [Thiopseudomonas alkaliphila]AKX58239.1 sulfur relay protein TusC [Thiopseudomonas alkaliphila]
MQRKLLLIAKSAPWSSLNARELLDIALSGGAFELPISLLFMGDGVLQPLAQQQPTVLEQKNLSANLQALPLFEIDAVYVSADCLAKRGQLETERVIAATVVDTQQITQLLASHDQVIVL